MLLRLLFSIFVFLFSVTHAQIIISGKVTAKGKAVKNVSVTLKDTYDGATTDANGNYSFQTTETGNHVVTFSVPDFADVSKDVSIAAQNLVVNAEMKSSFNEISGVVLTSESITSSGKNRSNTLLTPLDFVTTPGGEGQITATLKFLPGTQKIGDTEGLFVRGGTNTETKTFIDGNLVNNYFTNSTPGIAGRDRFNSSIFKRNDFSRGAYSALYGQALSSVLVLETIDLPEKTSADLFVMPILYSGSYQNVNTARTSSYGIQASYLNMNWFTKMLNFNTDFDQGPKSFSTNANFRIRTKGGGFIKYYGSYDSNLVGILQPSLEADYVQMKIKMKGENTYHNLSYREKFGKYLLNVGTSFSYNKNYLNLNFLNDNQQGVYQIGINNKGSYFNSKAVVERRLYTGSTIRGGVEFQNSIEDMVYAPMDKTAFKKHYNDLISSTFVEADLPITPRFSATVGTRVENSSYLKKWNMAPRGALGYRLSKDWTTSFSYGIFYQNPESRYINYPAPLGFQRADHYVLQIQKINSSRNFRFEVFYKDYQKLTKTYSFMNPEDQNSYSGQQTAVNVNGGGYAKGIEVFWRDKKTIKSLDYWISYSYLDSKRDFNNYPYSMAPTFAAKHTLSVVAKRFITDLKTQINASYSFASGRPYYDLVSENGNNIIRHEGTLKSYSSLNMSLNYLPNLGKKEAKVFTIIFLGVDNILNQKNIYGYNFSGSGNRSPILPVANTTVYVGAIFQFGIDRTKDTLENNF
ncbi:TonB-dependent receptor [Elizabethkingia meningoseptica]|uniref:TonB-dependent receptor n=1 Tax=Elizabethkingia meningoseptica TaxID=238 RepID=UPI0023AEE3B7|nr:carboxypeptidase-like regulatory domain-containing protein [Elizabethkingia meningoseptica]MDE5492161.1 TonB-dependent receptor [Elizabethkingia meningoseptica]